MANLLSSLLTLLRKLIGGEEDAATTTASQSISATTTSTATAHYSLSDDVRRYILAGLSDEDKASVEKQIAAHDGEREYTLSYSRGYYLIRKGQIAASGSGASR